MKSLRDNLRALPPQAWILYAGTFITRFGTFVVPFLVLYLTGAGYTPAQAGMAVGAYGAGHFLASILGGHLADRVGRRNTIALSMFGSAAAMLALSQARGFGTIAAVTCISGLASELYRPAASALLVDLVAPERRVFAFGMYRFAVNLAVAAGPATAGFLAGRSFLYLFAGDAITSVVYGIIALAALPHGLRSLAREERAGDAFRSAAADRPFLLFLLATICLTIVDFQMVSTLPLHVVSVGLPASAYGLLVSLNGALVVCFELWITNFVQRLPPRPVMATGYLLWGIGFSLTGVADTFPLLAATAVLWTLGEMVSSPMSAAYVAQLAPDRYRGRYMGFLGMSWSIGLLAGPPLGTWIFERDPAVLWAGCGVLGAISAAVLLLPVTRRTANSVSRDV